MPYYLSLNADEYMNKKNKESREARFSKLKKECNRKEFLSALERGCTNFKDVRLAILITREKKKN